MILFLKSSFPNLRNKNSFVQRTVAKWESPGHGFFPVAELGWKRSGWMVPGRLRSAARTCISGNFLVKVSWYWIMSMFVVYLEDLSRKPAPTLEDGITHHGASALEFLWNRFCAHCEGRNVVLLAHLLVACVLRLLKQHRSAVVCDPWKKSVCLRQIEIIFRFLS